MSAIGATPDVRVCLRKSDVMQAIKMYLNQTLLKRGMDVIELDVSEDDDGDSVFTVTLEEPKPQVGEVATIGAVNNLR